MDSFLTEAALFSGEQRAVREPLLQKATLRPGGGTARGSLSGRYVMACADSDAGPDDVAILIARDDAAG